MSNEQRTVGALRDEIIAATAELRTVAQAEHDEARAHVADWLDGLFAGVTEEKELQEASTKALTLYRGGMGSFQDVGTAASEHVVRGLRAALEYGRTLGAEPVASEPAPAAGPRTAPTSRIPRTVQAARDEIIAAIAELRAAAELGQDRRRVDAADWLEELFVDVVDRRGLREASTQALTLYRGGMGSFQDVGYEAAGHAVDRLRVALRRGRSCFLRNS
ncbi:DUF6966 domain-containing protein [Arthrobacter sp. TMS2-4]